MADQKISELTQLAAANIAATDELAIVDTSATETKRVTASDLSDYVNRNVYDDFADLNANGTGDAGTILTTKKEGFSYECVASATSTSITLASGQEVEAVGPALNADAFPTIEDAFTAAAESGMALKGTPGETYTFETGITLTDPTQLIADFTGCNLVRGTGVGDAVNALKVVMSYDAATYADATAISSLDSVAHDFGGGDVVTTRITLTDVSGYTVGDVVKVLSSDIITAISPWTEMRYACLGEVGEVDSGNNYLYLRREIYESAQYTSGLKLVKATAGQVEIVGGTWYDETGYAATRNAPLVEVWGAIRPLFREMYLSDTAGTQIVARSCYEPRHEDCRHDRARHLPANDAYGYGIKFNGGTTRPVSVNPQGSWCRHIVDTGGMSISSGDLNTTDPMYFGGVSEMQVISGVGFDGLNAPFATHPDAYRATFLDCAVAGTNKGSPSSKLFGLHMRGRGDRAIGGNYSSLAPIKCEPSTSATMLLKDVGIVKFAATEADAGLNVAVDIDGDGLASGTAKVEFQDMYAVLSNGDNDVFNVSNAEVQFSGKIRYNCDGNADPVVFNLDNGSTLVLGDTDLDFRGGVVSTGSLDPKVVKLVTANDSVYAYGRVKVQVTGATGTPTVTLADFNSLAGSAWFADVVTDEALTGKDGWANDGSAAAAVLHRYQRLGKHTTVHLASFLSSEIADVANEVNTVGKREGSIVYDSSNNRIMIARNNSAAGPWDVADGSASVTPS